jgi:radical SAM protein (TIGR04043 family)
MLSREELRCLCVDLQSRGIRFPDGMPGRAGGAGPADSRTVILEQQCISVPACSRFVAASPYRAEPDDGSGFILYNRDRALGRLQVSPQPEFYRHQTAAGTAYKKLALLHGRDCLASTLYQDCSFRTHGEQCHFCGIDLSLADGSTVLCKDPAELAEVAQHAARTAQAAHVTLTCGCREDERSATAHLAACVRSIKERSDLPVHIQICPPESDSVLEALHAAGADTVGIHIETLDMDVLRQVAPGKARCGLERYHRAWQQAVALFGKNQVSSFLIAGLGETAEALVAGARELCGMGVFPYVLPLRPLPGTPLEYARPPAPDCMVALYRAVAAVLREHGLSSKASRAGCVRCGACSCLSLFEDES